MEVLLFIIGACLGSFFLVVGKRLPINEDVLFSRSRCDKCKKELKWYDLIPIFSYVFLKGNVCKSMNKVVYHYCSVDTFFNIIKNSSMWLSDISKSNDYQECVRCREFVNKGMEEYLRDDVEALKAWGIWYENGVHSNFLMKTFCVCFSESKDKLSQWRGYAQDGKGIAIGFDKEVL